MRHRTLVLRVLRVTALSAVARAPGFLVPMLMAMVFGAGPETDAYFLAYSTLLLVSFGAGLETAIVPYAAQALRSGPAIARAGLAAYARQAFWWGCGAVVAGALLLVVGITVVNRGGVQVGLAGAMFALLAPVAVATCIGGIYSGTLVSGFRLERVAVSNVFRGLGGLLGVAVATAVRQLWPIPIGLAAGEVARMLWLKAGTRPLVAAATSAAAVPPENSFGRTAAYQASVQLLYATPTLERLLVAGTVGAISHVEYAVRVLTIAYIAFDGGVAPWLLAHWTNRHSDGQLVNTWRGVYRPLAVGAAMALAGGVLLAVFAPTIVHVLFLRGKFSAADAGVVASLLRWYAPAFVSYMTAFCVERLLLARGQNALFLRLNVLRTATRVGVVLLLVPHLGTFALPPAMFVAETAYLVAALFATRSLGSEPVLAT